jgi:hypothetical protein
VLAKEATIHAEETSSVDREDFDVLAAGGDYLGFISKSERISAPIIDAFSINLGKCVFPV